MRSSAWLLACFIVGWWDLICISRNYECCRKQMQVFVAPLVCICWCAFYVPVAKQKVVDQHGAWVERYNLVQLLVQSCISGAQKNFSVCLFLSSQMTSEIQPRPSPTPPQRPLPVSPSRGAPAKPSSGAGGLLVMMPPAVGPKPVGKVTSVPPLRALR